MSAARVIDLQAARERRDQRRPMPVATPTPPRFIWVPMVVWVPVRWA